MSAPTFARMPRKLEMDMDDQSDNSQSSASDIRWVSSFDDGGDDDDSENSSFAHDRRHNEEHFEAHENEDDDSSDQTYSQHRQRLTNNGHNNKQNLSHRVWDTVKRRLHLLNVYLGIDTDDDDAESDGYLFMEDDGDGLSIVASSHYTVTTAEESSLSSTSSYFSWDSNQNIQDDEIIRRIR